MDCQYPPVFRGFLIYFEDSLTEKDRAHFKLWCKGVIPDSKLDVKMKPTEAIVFWIDCLLSNTVLSVKDMSWLGRFLIKVGRHDLLKMLNKVELQISLGIILKEYVRLENDLRDEAPLKLARNRPASVAKFLLAIKEKNKELIRRSTLNLLEQVEADSISIQKIMDSYIPESSQLSWQIVTSYLVVIGDFIVSLCRQFPNVAPDGCYMCLFSNTKACEALSSWILKNGGLEAFQVFIEKQETAIGKSVSSTTGERLKEDVELLGSLVDAQGSH